MKKIYFLFLFSCAVVAAKATNYYVDAVNGAANNPGTSPALAFSNIQKAADLTNPGDTVFILTGTYTNTSAVLSIARSGNASAQIVYTNYRGSTPKLKASITTYNIIFFVPGTSYITLNGLEVEGYGVNLSLAADTTPAQAQLSCPVPGSAATSEMPLTKYNGNGISADSRSISGGCHHVVVSNCKVHDCGGGGISFIKADYITLDGNTVYNNAWYNIYGASGISFNEFYDFDSNTGTYRNTVSNNVCYNNRMYVFWRAVCKITDGNGIILDVPTSTYTGRSLVVNNIVFNNGGSGIHSFKMNHVDMIHNTGYYNSQSPAISSGEIYARQADDVKIYNNILVSRPDKLVNGVNGSTNLVYDYNVYFGGSSVDLVGLHSFIQNPQFVHASTDPVTADFHLQAGSVAIDHGDNTRSTPVDKAGVARPIHSVVEMGAYETANAGSPTGSGTQQTKIVGSGNGTGEPGPGSYLGPYDTRIGTSNSKSRRAFIYPQQLLSTIPANSIIASLQFRRALPTGVTPQQPVPDNSTIRLYLRNEAADNFGSAAFDWNSIMPAAANPAVLVYGGEASPLAGNAGGWQTVPFQVPFTYTGGNLAVFVEYLQKDFVASAPDILWLYDNGGSQPLYNTTTYPSQLYATKSATTSGSGIISNSLAANNERRPVLTVGYYPLAALPVALRQLTAVKRGTEIYLNWMAGIDINNEGFEVQRSGDGVTFVPIGFVHGKSRDASGAALSSYAFTDQYPIAGKAFYRLAQKDKDGKIVYSAIVTAANDAATVSLISLYPNPAGSNLHALVSTYERETEVNVRISSLSGRLVSSFRKQLVPGYNDIEINTGQLAASAYLLQIEWPSGRKLVEKFVKK